MKNGVQTATALLATIASAGLSGQAKGDFMHAESVMTWAPMTANVGRGEPGYDEVRDVVVVSESTFNAMGVPGIVANGIADYTNLPMIADMFGRVRRQVVPIFENVASFSPEPGSIHRGGGGGGGSVPQGPPVPEPGVLTLVVAGGACFMSAYRRTRSR